MTAQSGADIVRSGRLSVTLRNSSAYVLSTHSYGPADVRGDGLQKALQVDTFLAKPLDVDKLLAIAATHCPRDPKAEGPA